MKKILLGTVVAASLLLSQTNGLENKTKSKEPTVEELRELYKKANYKLKLSKDSKEESFVHSLMLSLPVVSEIADDIHWSKCNDSWKNIDIELEKYGTTKEWGLLIGLKYLGDEKSKILYETLIFSSRALNCGDREALEDLSLLTSNKK